MKGADACNMQKEDFIAATEGTLKIGAARFGISPKKPVVPTTKNESEGAAAARDAAAREILKLQESAGKNTVIGN